MLTSARDRPGLEGEALAVAAVVLAAGVGGEEKDRKGWEVDGVDAVEVSMVGLRLGRDAGISCEGLREGKSDFCDYWG